MTCKLGRCLLKEHLLRIDMSQQELAELTGLTKQTISRYVRGVYIMSLENANKIALVIGCHVEDLYEIIRE